ncbi:histidine kinase [Streptomyces albiaxialis]|uniref:Histidine kinase n=1 Tax=Streptomyces albiaxialis TaxID=329523 RepID=A0ABN2VSC9_9ACTN
MIGWARDKRRGWYRRSSHEQVETSSRWMLNVTPWAFYIGGIPQLLAAARHSPTGTALAWSIAAVGLAQCLLVRGGLRQGLDCYLGEAEPPRRRIAVLAVLMVVLTALVTAVVATGGLEKDPQAPGLTMFAVLAPFPAVYGLTVTWRQGARVVGAYLVVPLVAFALAGMGPGDLAPTAFLMLVAGGVNLFTPRSSAWYIAVMRELAEAREAQARLAVAEERLRFGRDLHDVMGRNLSVIALKSELAVQLARRGPEAAEKAVEQMNEVQRLARESQTEVREVVRGYREAGLATELAGARGVLRAAGVDCRIEGADADVPPRAESALGWVVREAATNVLRHAEATYCTVRVRVRVRGGAGNGTGTGTGAVVLEVENDGARGDAGPPEGGSGLPGLRERLAALGGTLTAGHDGRGTFRLRAEVPREDTASSGTATRDGAASGGGAGDGSGSGDHRVTGEGEGDGDGGRRESGAGRGAGERSPAHPRAAGR